MFCFSLVCSSSVPIGIFTKIFFSPKLRLSVNCYCRVCIKIMQDLINLDNPVLRAFLFYASILIGKTMIMAPLTAHWRFKKGVSAWIYFSSSWGRKEYLGAQVLPVYLDLP